MRSLTPLASLLLGMATLSSNFIANDMGTLRTHLSKASSRWVNPLLEEWTGPYNGVPPFDHVVVADFKPAIEAAIQEGLSEVNKIADDLSGANALVPGIDWMAGEDRPPAGRIARTSGVGRTRNGDARNRSVAGPRLPDLIASRGTSPDNRRADGLRTRLDRHLDADAARSRNPDTFAVERHFDLFRRRPAAAAAARA